MHSFTAQYKALYLLSWIILYLIFPSWTLPVTVNMRAVVYLGLILYLCVSAYFTNRWLETVTVDKPVFVKIRWRHLVKDHTGLIIVCCIAAVLHIYPISLPILILGDETIHLQGGLWIYEYIDPRWHRLVQIAFWMIIGVLVLLRRKGIIHNLLYQMSRSHIGATGKILFRYFLLVLCISAAAVYFFF